MKSLIFSSSLFLIAASQTAFGAVCHYETFCSQKQVCRVVCTAAGGAAGGAVGGGAGAGAGIGAGTQVCSELCEYVPDCVQQYVCDNTLTLDDVFGNSQQNSQQTPSSTEETPK